VPPVVVHRLARPEASQQVQAFIQALGEHDRVGRLAEAAEFVLDRPAQARTEDHLSAAEGVQGGHLAGELLRTPPGDRGDQRAQPDPGGRQRRGGQQHPRIAEGPAVAPVHDVIPDEQPVPARLLRRRGDRRHLPGIGEVPEVRNVDRESHPASLRTGRHLDDHAQYRRFGRGALRAEPLRQDQEVVAVRDDEVGEPGMADLWVPEVGRGC
jgi:hypothetical protein